MKHHHIRIKNGKYFRCYTTYYIQNEQQADVVTDVINRFFEQDLVDNDASYYEYEVKDTDTPEIIADKFYGSPERHWIVLGLNQIIDYNGIGFNAQLL